MSLSELPEGSNLDFGFLVYELWKSKSVLFQATKFVVNNGSLKKMNHSRYKNGHVKSLKCLASIFFNQVMLHVKIFRVLNTLGNSQCFHWSLFDPEKIFQFPTFSFLCHLWLLVCLWLTHLTLGSSGPFYTMCSATALSTSRLYMHLPFFFHAKQIGFLSQAASTSAVVSVSAQAWKQVCRPTLAGEKFVKKQPIYKLHIHII